MKVRCVSTYVTEEQRAALGRQPYQGSLVSGLTIGSEYLVLGIAFAFDPDGFATGPHVLVIDDFGFPKSHDLCLFEITDPQVSRYWQMRASEFDNQQLVELMPPDLFELLAWPDKDTRSLDQQDVAFFATVRSAEFLRICAMLQEEFRNDDVSETKPDS